MSALRVGLKQQAKSLFDPRHFEKDGHKDCLHIVILYNEIKSTSPGIEAITLQHLVIQVEK